MQYSPQDLAQGQSIKSQSQETPSTFGTVDGATNRIASRGFGKSRMAGEVGARAIQLMTDPAEEARTQAWMDQFGYSNQGYEFNQAKMMRAGVQPVEGTEEQQ